MEAGNNVHTDSRDQIQHESQQRVKESILNREGLSEGEAEERQLRGRRGSQGRCQEVAG